MDLQEKINPLLDKYWNTNSRDKRCDILHENIAPILETFLQNELMQSRLYPTDRIQWDSSDNEVHLWAGASGSVCNPTINLVFAPGRYYRRYREGVFLTVDLDIFALFNEGKDGFLKSVCQLSEGYPSFSFASSGLQALCKKTFMKGTSFRKFCKPSTDNSLIQLISELVFSMQERAEERPGTEYIDDVIFENLEFKYPKPHKIDWELFVEDFRRKLEIIYECINNASKLSRRKFMKQ